MAMTASKLSGIAIEAMTATTLACVTGMSLDDREQPYLRRSKTYAWRSVGCRCFLYGVHLEANVLVVGATCGLREHHAVSDAVQHRITVDGVDNLMLTGRRERGACIYVKHVVLGPCCTPWVWHIHGVNGLGCVTALCRPFAYLSVHTAFSSSGRLWLLSECGSVLHVSAPVRRGAAADTRLGVA